MLVGVDLITNLVNGLTYSEDDCNNVRSCFEFVCFVLEGSVTEESFRDMRTRCLPPRKENMW